MTPAELRALYLEALQAGDADLANLYLDRIEAAQAPGAVSAPEALRAPVQPQPFAPPSATRAAMEQQAAEQAEALTARRVLSPVEREQERQQEEQRAMQVLELERARPVQPGVGAVRQEQEAIIPMLRATRLQRLPVYRQVPEDLRATMTPEEVAAFETREPRAGTDVQPIELRTYYRTPEGIREPTTGERFIESFAQQQLLTEEEARQQAAMQDEALQAALRGERLPPLSATVPGLALQALLMQRPGQEAGVVETPLMAGMRGVAQLGSAAAAETIGTSYEAGGVPTQRTEVTAMDPEGRRRASQDPEFVNRVLENVATGRGIADEFYDVDVFRNAAGDVAAGIAGEEYREAGEMGAFWAGMGLDVLMPGYLGAAKGAVKGASLAGKPVLQVARPAAQRSIATRIINQSRLEEVDRQAALAAIRASDGTEAGIAAAVQPHLQSLGDGAADAFATELRSRIPADYVFVSERIAVPRAVSQQAGEAAQRAARDATQRSTDAQAEYLRTLAALADDTSPQVSSRVAALADTHFPGTAGQQVRGGNLAAVQGSTSDALRKAADALEASPNRTARTSATNALRTFEDQAGIAPGTLQRRLVERAPAEVADSLPQAIRQQVRQAENWASLEGRIQDEALEALRSQAAISAARGAGLAPRTAGELTNLQVYIRDMNPWVAATQRINDGELARWVRAYIAKRPLPPASVVRAVEKVRGSAETALRSAAQQIAATAKQTGSVDRAFEDFLVRNTADMSGEARWQKVLETLYGPPDQTLPAARYLFRDLDAVPVTVDNIKVLNAKLGEQGIVPKVSIWSTPARRAMMKAALDEGIRKRLVAEGVALEGRLTSPTGEVFGLPGAAPGLPRWTILAGGETLTAPAAGGGARVYSKTASNAEKLLGEASQELLPYLSNLAPAQRTSWLNIIRDSGENLLGAGRSGLQGLKYGFEGIPNLPFLMYRLTEAPILSLSTIGAERTLAGLARMSRTKLDDVMQRLGARRMGGGLTSVEGRYYSPAELQKLADDYGIGVSRVETERVLNLSNDLQRIAIRATKDKAGRALMSVQDAFNPAAQGFWQQAAHSVEMSYRRSVFEGALAAGSSASEAADLARRSLGDYSAAPQMVQNIGRYLATAQGQYLLVSELVTQAIKNPASIGSLSRAMLARQKAKDPYNLDGDAALTRLGIVRGGEGADAQRFYGPSNPIFEPIDAALRVMRHSSVLIGDIKRVGKAVSEGDSLTAGQRFWDGFVNLVSVASPAFAAWMDLQDIEAGGEPLTLSDPVSAERVFWQSMVAARAADPDGRAGIWQAWLDIARPEVVPPPDGLGHPVLDDVWLRQPAEGVPHVLYAYDDQGRPLYKVYKPSPRGMVNIELARAATPDALERAFGAMAALIDMPAGSRPGMSVEAGAPPVQVFGGVQAPRGAGAAAGLLFGQPAGPADPVAARRAQIEQLRQAREGQ